MRKAHVREARIRGHARDDLGLRSALTQISAAIQSRLRRSRSADHLGAGEIHEPADPNSSRAPNLFNTEMGKLGLRSGRVARETGVREHGANGGEARWLAPNRPSECEVTVGRAPEHLQADAIATLHRRGSEDSQTQSGQPVRTMLRG
jgi:hypothetical protein